MGLSLCVYITTRLKRVVYMFYGPQTELKITFIF